MSTSPSTLCLSPSVSADCVWLSTICLVSKEPSLITHEAGKVKSIGAPVSMCTVLANSPPAGCVLCRTAIAQGIHSSKTPAPVGRSRKATPHIRSLGVRYKITQKSFNVSVSPRMKCRMWKKKLVYKCMNQLY